MQCLSWRADYGAACTAHPPPPIRNKRRVPSRHFGLLHRSAGTPRTAFHEHPRRLSCWPEVQGAPAHLEVHRTNLCGFPPNPVPAPCASTQNGSMAKRSIRILAAAFPRALQSRSLERDAVQHFWRTVAHSSHPKWLKSSGASYFLSTPNMYNHHNFAVVGGTATGRNNEHDARVVFFPSTRARNSPQQGSLTISSFSTSALLRIRLLDAHVQDQSRPTVRNNIFATTPAFARGLFLFVGPLAFRMSSTLKNTSVLHAAAASSSRNSSSKRQSSSKDP